MEPTSLTTLPIVLSPVFGLMALSVYANRHQIRHNIGVIKREITGESAATDKHNRDNQ